jgi:uncharacterized protein YegP (UPF0339 family)
MHFEIYREKQGGLSSKSGDYRWRLVADNGRTIADSGEGYVDKAGCEHGMNLVKQADANTPVHDNYARDMLIDALKSYTSKP